MNQHSDRQDAVNSEEEDAGGGPDRGVFYANALFERHGVPVSDRSRLAEKVLKLAYSAAHRRMRGEKSLTFREMTTLADHFGESLDHVFAAAAEAESVEATLVIAGERLTCQLWVGQAIDIPVPGKLVATKEDSRWTVLSFAGQHSQGPFFEVQRVIIEPKTVFMPRIAVLDDQPAITEPLCAFLKQAGFKADAFHSIGALEATLDKLYDAYVLDWVVGDDTVSTLVGNLKQRDPRCPIAILTGKANERGEVAQDIADLMVQQQNVHYFNKPLDPRMLTVVLTRMIEARQRG